MYYLPIPTPIWSSAYSFSPWNLIIASSTATFCVGLLQTSQQVLNEGADHEGSPRGTKWSLSTKIKSVVIIDRMENPSTSSSPITCLAHNEPENRKHDFFRHKKTDNSTTTNLCSFWCVLIVSIVVVLFLFLVYWFGVRVFHPNVFLFRLCMIRGWDFLRILVCRGGMPVSKGH